VDVVLAGVPRSGTTLVCRLLNDLADTVALVEPMDVSALAADPPSAGRRVEDFFAQARRSLRERGRARSKHVDGRVPDDTAGEGRNARGLRVERTRAGDVSFDKVLSEDFLLVVKHPGAFTALLPVLGRRFRCFAVVRNPLATLASWNAVDYPVREGRLPVAERLDPGLAAALRGARDVLDRQLRLMSWFFEAYAQLPAAHVLRYEDIVRTGGRALTVLTARASALGRPLIDRNHAGRGQDWYEWAERLLASEGAYWRYYSRPCVEALCRAGDEVAR
jgi:hypothetical protein